MRTVSIVVLQDGETYSGLDKCEIMVITEEDSEALAAGEISLDELRPIFEMEMREFDNGYRG